MSSQGLRPEGYFLLKEGATKSCKWGTNAVESNSSHCCTSSGSSQHLHILQFYSLSLLFLPTDGRGSSWLSDGLPRVLQPLLERLLPPLLLVQILLFPAMPPLFATHPTSGNPTFRNNKPENEPGHVLTKLNQGQSEVLFLFTFENLLFESNQTRRRPKSNPYNSYD